MTTTPKPLVLITGASTGLGLAIARVFLATREFRVMLTARQSSLHRFADAGIVADESTLIRTLDVTDMNQRIAVINECESYPGGLSILINNAGVACRSVVEHASAQDRICQMEVNYIGPMRLIALVLPHMRKRRGGRIINISSAAGIVGMATMACYCASKFALEGATEALWYEVRPWNIFPTLIIPGFIRSDSHLHTQMTVLSRRAMRSSAQEDPYQREYLSMVKLIDRIMRNALADPDTIARRILAVARCQNPPLRCPVTLDAWILFFLRRFLPRRLYHWAMFHALPQSDRWGMPGENRKHRRNRGVQKSRETTISP